MCVNSQHQPCWAPAGQHCSHGHTGNALTITSGCAPTPFAACQVATGQQGAAASNRSHTPGCALSRPNIMFQVLLHQTRVRYPPCTADRGGQRRRARSPPLHQRFPNIQGITFRAIYSPEDEDYSEDVDDAALASFILLDARHMKRLTRLSLSGASSLSLASVMLVCASRCTCRCARCRSVRCARHGKLTHACTMVCKNQQ